DATRQRRIEEGARHPRQGGEGTEVPDELLVEAQGVGLVEEEGRPEGGAEGPEEDEAGHQPRLPLAEGAADGAPRLSETPAIAARTRLVHAEAGHDGGEEGKAGGEEEGRVQLGGG